uniref:Uncharacterized protein n=1 Tax=Laccaria bicolor TaxID=29883 RepID=A0A4D6T0B7_LACBI|nr:hypothetical protein [Laccaria bicolor]QCG70088.1 hypothetical protein [Laccaria bicolor]
MMKLKIFLKRILASIINKCKEFVSMLLNSRYFSKEKLLALARYNNMVINIISYFFLILIYWYLWDLKGNNTFQIFIFTKIFFAVSMFISDNFKLSNNKFIKILQKFVFINSFLFIIGLILYIFDVSIFNTRNLPSNFNSGFIHSVLEESEIPLILMVNGLCYLNYIEFSLILSLFSLLFRKYLNRKLKGLILKLKNKYIKNKEVESINDENVSLNKEVESINDENVSLNKAFNTVDKYTDYLIVFVFICLIWIKFINIFFSDHLAENIDSFVKVYNHIKKF